MDSLTHIALGACLGEAFAGKKVGKKAMLWGILAQSIPDFDFILTPFLATSKDLLVHRGFSHSILFVILLAPLLALLAEKLHRTHDISYKSWVLFFVTSIGLHLFIDGFNNYGIGWLEPFSHSRFSFNTIYVADPLFSIGPAIAAALLLITRKNNAKRIFWWKFGLLCSLFYLSYSAVNKLIIDKNVNTNLKKLNISSTHYFTTPAPFQNLLWFTVAATDSGFYAGYRSVFDNGPLQLTYYPKNQQLLAPYINRDDIKRLVTFSQGYYTTSISNDTLMFNDLRFGQVVGWMNPKENFSFHYFIQYPDKNNLVVQRGRFEKFDRKAFKGLLTRASGCPLY